MSDQERMSSGGLVAKTPDALPPTSRAFYEQTLFKAFLSIVYAAVALFFLGLCSQAAGQSRASFYTAEQATISEIEDGLNAMVTGYGFGSFFFFCSFAIMLGAAFHISPLVTGSNNESRTLKTPLDLERSS